MHSVGRKKTLQLDTSKLLGKGSLGYVFKGKYENNIDVAIKRMQKADHETDRIEKIEREREMLKTLNHPNIIRYRFSDFDKDFFYIALDLCDGTLLDLLNKQNTDVTIPPKYVGQADKVSFKIKLLKDIADGLNYLHAQEYGSIIHGDLTPQNVLLKKMTESQDSWEMKAMISDFGLSLKLEEDLSSITASDAGTRGWKAKELLVRGKKKLKTSADVFAFGCLVQFTLSLSRNEQDVHPFGDLILREVNILNDNRCFYLYGRHLNASSPKYDYLLGDILIDLCINSRAPERLTTHEILEHPLFWSCAKKLLFVSEIFNRFNTRNRYVNDPVIEGLEAMWNELNFDRNYYIPRLLPEVWNEYDRKPTGGREDTLFFFMRLMRNVKQHFHEYEHYLGDVLGNGSSTNFVRYFFGRVPPAFSVIYIMFYCNGPEGYYDLEVDHVLIKRSIAWNTVLHHYGFDD